MDSIWVQVLSETTTSGHSCPDGQLSGPDVCGRNKMESEEAPLYNFTCSLIFFTKLVGLLDFWDRLASLQVHLSVSCYALRNKQHLPLRFSSLTSSSHSRECLIQSMRFHQTQLTT